VADREADALSKRLEAYALQRAATRYNALQYLPCIINPA
jgi:hypothetical protein